MKISLNQALKVALSAFGMCRTWGKSSRDFLGRVTR